ncbi:LmeA family phospholipid-binding protein [Streptomyces sp. 900105755]
MPQPHQHEPNQQPYEPYDPYEPYEPYDAQPAYEPPAAPRRTRRPAVAAVALLLLLVLVPVAVDRFLAVQVESRAAKAFQQGMHTPLPPEVHVHGFPVLAQVAAGSLRDVDVTAHDIPADDTTSALPVSELSLHLAGLTKSDDDRQARARSARATARLTYTDISDALGVAVSRGSGPGRLKATVALPLGNSVTATTTVSAAAGNRIAFKDFEVTAGPLSGPADAVLDKAFDQPLRLQNIPDGLHLRSITTTETGLSAYFSGTSVTFHAPDTAQNTATANTSSRLPT